MIEHNDQNNQLPKELKSVFNELEISKHLRNAGIKKRFGFTCTYLFQLVFCLIFHHKSWFTLLQSKKGDQYPAKDAVYRVRSQPMCRYLFRGGLLFCRRNLQERAVSSIDYYIIVNRADGS
jgi:hypothetical protein